MGLPLAAEIAAFHDRVIEAGAAARAPEGALWAEIARNHDCNRSVWSEEDLARRVDVEDREIAANKRAIDRYNQQRNDAIERIDAQLLAAMAPLNAKGRLSSETPGAMIDRLSILALRIHHMAALTLRSDADEEHRATCRVRHAVLLGQHRDLSSCFDRLLAECAVGSAYFKTWRVFKMYNDPALNPHLAPKGVKP